MWSDVANISFVQTTNASQAQIVFERGTDGGAETTPAFTDPGNGGNRDKISWKMVGYDARGNG